jgi:hypothetical protein
MWFALALPLIYMTVGDLIMCTVKREFFPAYSMIMQEATILGYDKYITAPAPGSVKPVVVNVEMKGMVEGDMPYTMEAPKTPRDKVEKVNEVVFVM